MSNEDIRRRRHPRHRLPPLRRGPGSGGDGSSAPYSWRRFGVCSALGAPPRVKTMPWVLIGILLVPALVMVIVDDRRFPEPAFQ